MLKPLHWLLSLLQTVSYGNCPLSSGEVQSIKRDRGRFLTLGDKGPTGIITRRGMEVRERKFSGRANVGLVLKTFTSMNPHSNNIGEAMKAMV